MSLILKGSDRRELVRAVALRRAVFEVEYEGKPIVQFDREQVVWGICWHRNVTRCDVLVSDALVREIQKEVPRQMRLARAIVEDR